jgi:hypothetical protein
MNEYFACAQRERARSQTLPDLSTMCVISRKPRTPVRKSLPRLRCRQSLPLLATGGADRSSTVLESAEDFEAVAGDLETGTCQAIDEIGGELCEELRVELGRHVADLAGFNITEVVMVVAPAVVAGGAVTAVDSSGEAGVYEGLERVVDSGKADFRDAHSNGAIDFVGGGMRIDAGKVVPDFTALCGVAAAGGLQSVPNFIERAGAMRVLFERVAAA